MTDYVSLKKKSYKMAKGQKQLYMCLYLISYLSFSFASTQFTPFLSYLGYEPLARGLLLASYAVTTLVFQLVLGFLADKYQTVKRVLASVLLIYGLASFSFFSFSKQHFFWHMLFIAISGGLLNTATGLLDTWVLQSQPVVSKSLSFLKAFGSVGWALGSVVVSTVVSRVGYRGMGITMLLLVGIAIALTTFLTEIMVTQKNQTKSELRVVDCLLLLKDKRYCLLVLILFLLYAVIICNNITVIDKMLLLHASTLEIGYKWSLQSLFEIPAYLIGGSLLQKFKGYNLLTICSIALFIQFLLYANATTIQQMIVISSMQIFTTPLLMVSSKVLIYELSNDQMKATGQMLALSIFIGLSSMVSPIIAGYLVQTQGIYLTLIMIALVPLVALGLLIYLRRIVTNKT